MILRNFIVFEGIDGSGTSTQLKALQKKLSECENAKKFLFTQEPSVSSTGKFIREVLSGKIKLSDKTIAYLFAADRSEHIDGKILLDEEDKNHLITGISQSCKNGNFVVSDRYLFSSLVYQSIGSDSEIPRFVNSRFPLPELVFYFDIDAKTALERISLRGEEKEIYEKQEFLEKATNEYKKVISEYKENPDFKDMKIFIIDAKLTAEEISKIIWTEIKKLPIFET